MSENTRKSGNNPDNRRGKNNRLKLRPSRRWAEKFARAALEAADECGAFSEPTPWLDDPVAAIHDQLERHSLGGGQ